MLRTKTYLHKSNSNTHCVEYINEQEKEGWSVRQILQTRNYYQEFIVVFEKEVEFKD